MTIKEAILKSLEAFPNGATPKEVYKYIVENSVMEFNKNAKTPADTVSAQMSVMSRHGDSRIKRFKNGNKAGHYYYYLTKFASNFQGNEEDNPHMGIKSKDNFLERDLHPLLCTFLQEHGIIAKTIFHEKSNKAEEHQKWIHPDIVGVKFSSFEDKTCDALFKALGKKNSLKLYAYELKREINNDYDLKRCFFQAVSNSSWANFGYLVSFNINETLRDELERLNHSFGIGYIQLKANPFESQIWFPARENVLDFSTINKICKANPDFTSFINGVEAAVTADDKHFGPSLDSLKMNCDNILESESKIKSYCQTHHIPITEED